MGWDQCYCPVNIQYNSVTYKVKAKGINKKHYPSSTDLSEGRVWVLLPLYTKYLIIVIHLHSNHQIICHINKITRKMSRCNSTSTCIIILSTQITFIYLACQRVSFKSFKAIWAVFFKNRLVHVIYQVCI